MLGSVGNVVTGDDIGTDAAGAAAMGNFRGIVINGGNNLIGGTAVADRNVVSGNYHGDTTLDGKVDAADNGQVAAGLQNTGTGWAFGDFDYSGGKPTASDNSLFAGGLSGYKQFGSL